jgi:hypothetical protein
MRAHIWQNMFKATNIVLQYCAFRISINRIYFTSAYQFYCGMVSVIAVGGTTILWIGWICSLET